MELIREAMTSHLVTLIGRAISDIIEFNDVEYSDSLSHKFIVRSREDFHRDYCYLQNINEYRDRYLKKLK